jgi:hypothetical protein
MAGIAAGHWRILPLRVDSDEAIAKAVAAFRLSYHGAPASFEAACC